MSGGAKRQCEQVLPPPPPPVSELVGRRGALCPQHPGSRAARAAAGCHAGRPRRCRPVSVTGLQPVGWGKDAARLPPPASCPAGARMLAQQRAATAVLALTLARMCISLRSLVWWPADGSASVAAATHGGVRTYLQLVL